MHQEAKAAQTDFNDGKLIRELQRRQVEYRYQLDEMRQQLGQAKSHQESLLGKVKLMKAAEDKHGAEIKEVQTKLEDMVQKLEAEQEKYELLEE